MVQQLVEREQVIEIIARDIVENLLASISIQMTDNELEEMSLDVRQINANGCRSLSSS